jgi:hypothetical protein
MFQVVQSHGTAGPSCDASEGVESSHKRIATTVAIAGQLGLSDLSGQVSAPFNAGDPQSQCTEATFRAR